MSNFAIAGLNQKKQHKVPKILSPLAQFLLYIRPQFHGSFGKTPHFFRVPYIELAFKHRNLFYPVNNRIFYS